MFVRNNVQELRSVEELNEALEDARAHLAGAEELSSVLRQIRQELAARQHLPGARELHREACRAQGAVAAKARDLSELLALSDAHGGGEWSDSVALLAVALLREEEEEEQGRGCPGRETELNVLLARCEPGLSRLVAALVAGNAAAVAREAAAAEGAADACVAQLLRLAEEAARRKVKARFDKCFRGTHRMQR